MSLSELTSRIVVALLVLGATTIAQPVPPAEGSAATPAPEPRCIISIDTLRVDNGGLYDTLDVVAEMIGLDLAGFGLKLGTHNGYLDIVDILPGEVIDSCGWYMFRASEVVRADDLSGPSELWQIAAMAQSFSSADTLLCYQFDLPASIARVVVSSAHVPLVPDTTAAVFFYWEACRDNVISDAVGAAILISDSVYDAYSTGIDTEPDRMPTTRGTPSDCVDGRVAYTPRRLVEFHNGGVEFRLNAEPTGNDNPSAGNERDN